ncbi:MAG: alkaline phosphatase [Halioglobus sp.]
MLQLVLLVSVTSATAQEQGPISTPSPANVILIIGDGMDDQQITIARNYLQGAAGRLTLDELPHRGAVQVLTQENRVDGAPVYVADSANTATSLATGVVTSRGRIATSAGDDKDLETLLELAAAQGLATGIVTTSSITDATPASFMAHISARVCESPVAMQDVTIRNIPVGDCTPDLKANGGPGSISEQIAASPVTLVLGGGLKHFTPQAEGSEQTVIEQARQAGFNVITEPADLASVASAERSLGLFASSHLPVRLRGTDGQEAQAPDPSLLNHVHRYLGDVTLPDPMACEPEPEYGSTPSLKAMTDAALARLSRNPDKGFFLMIESASIDKKSHERRPCGSIGEVAQLDEALQSALAFADQQPQTLIIVTADHAQAAQLIPSKSLFAAYPIPIFSPGMIARINTPEGALMTINYATNNFAYEEHTGATVPLAGNQLASDLVPGYTTQPELYSIMLKHLNLTD